MIPENSQWEAKGDAAPELPSEVWRMRAKPFVMNGLERDRPEYGGYSPIGRERGFGGTQIHIPYVCLTPQPI